MNLITQKHLSVRESHAKPISMKNSPENQELASWLIAVAQQRDQQAFKKLFTWFAPKILAIVSKQLINKAQAQDVLQETMTNVWRKAYLFYPEKGQAKTWVYTVMRNVLFDYLRKVKSNKEQNLSEDFWPMVEEHSLESEVFEDHLLKEKMVSIVDELPQAQQQVVRGFYFLELTQEQLAQQLHIPVGTVKSRLRLAIARIKAQIGESHD